jgi:Homeodomain-like domain
VCICHRVSATAMSGEQRTSRKRQLVIALAEGKKSLDDWAQENGVSRRTAYRWAKDPKVKADVNAHRRAAVDQSLAVMSGQLTWAAEAIGDLGKNAASDSVKLGALKAVFANLIAVSKFAGFETRLAALEERFHGRTGSAAGVA